MTKKPINRTLALIIGTLILFINGIVYAWSIYSAPFSEDFGWTSAQLGVCFTIVLIMFCLGGIFGSIVTSKVGSGKTIPAGGLIAALGYVISLLLTKERLPLLYAGFAVAGLGSGVAYNAVLSNVTARFPDKRGTASGVMLMGFGTSTLIMGSLATSLISSVGWKMTYIITASLLAVISVVGGMLLAKESEKKKAVASSDGMSTDYTPAEMLKTKTFWLLFLTASASCFFGFGVLGHARYVALDTGLEGQTATLVVGFVSVMNGIGRLFFGMLHDKKGYRVSFPVSSCIFILAAVFAVIGIRNMLPWVAAIGLMLGGFGNSAAPTIITSVAAEFFGSKHYGSNMSFLNTNMLVGSFGSTVAGSIRTSTGSYALAMTLFGFIQILPLLFILILARTREKKQQA